MRHAVNRPRASACRNAPPAAWKSRSVGGRCRNDRASAPSRYGQRGRMAERTPPVGKQGAGVGGAAAAVGKRRRERDAELQIQTPRLTVRRYEKWGTNIPGRATVGGRRQLPGARWRGRPVCARGGRPCRGSGGTNARVSVFFIHIHPRLRRRAPRQGGKADRSVQRPVRLVRCVGHGVGARGVGAVGLHPCGGARSTGCAGQRGGMRRGVKPNCAAWAVIRAAGQTVRAAVGYDSRRGVKPIAQCGLRFSQRG